MKKKILILLFIASLGVFVFQLKESFGQNFQEMVPVIDPKAIEALSRIADILDSLLSLHADQLQKSNQSLTSDVETKFNESINKIFTDALKIDQYREQAVNSLKFLQDRQRKAKDLNTVQSMIEEAKKSGAYKGLNDLLNNVSCIHPDIRPEFTNYILNLAMRFMLVNKAQEILATIPDCLVSSELTTPVVSKPNFFSWLIKPFQLNIAQIVSTPSGAETPTIAIEPAFEDTEKTIQLNNLRLLADNLIVNTAEELAQTRQEQIGNTFPIIDCINKTTDFDGGLYVCLDYKTLTSGEEIESLKSSITAAQSLDQTTQDINIFSETVEARDLLKKLGLITLPVVNSDIIQPITDDEIKSILNDPQKIQAIINKACGSYAIQAPATTTNDSFILNYIFCLKQIGDKLKTYAEVKKKYIEETKKYIGQTIDSLYTAINDADTTIRYLNGSNCSSAINDLQETIKELDQTITLYYHVSSTIDAAIGGINTSINNLDGDIKTLDNTINLISGSTDIANISNEVLRSFWISQRGNDIFNYPLNISIMPDIFNQLGVTDQSLIDKIEEVIDNFNKIIGRFSETIFAIDNINTALVQYNITKGDILSDSYDLQLILEKIAGYKELAASTSRIGCSGSPTSPGIVFLNKNQTIVVESKKPIIKSINFLALVRKLFQPKLVEIRNEK